MICICSSCSTNCIPGPIRQGERIEWTWTLCDHPADEYTLQFRFRGPDAGENVDATADGTSYAATFDVPAGWTPGKWAWQAWLTEIADTTNKFEIASGNVTVAAGFAEDDLAAVELRSPAEQALAAIDSQLSGVTALAEYEIETPAGRRRIKNFTRTELLSLRKHYAKIVSMERTRERVRKGGTLMRSIPINVRGR